MKYLVIFFLHWSGFFGANAGGAEESPAEDTHQATVGNDGEQHVRLLGGQYPFYCRSKLLFFESHWDKGMQGLLEVVQSGFPCSLP